MINGIRIFGKPAVQQWLNEDWFDFVLSHFSPTVRLGRTLARVVAVVDETPDMKTFVLRPNGLWRGFKPGQYVPVRVRIGGVCHERYYSLTGITQSPNVSFCVKRIEGGRVSNWLHENLKIGDVVELGEAGGSFTLAPGHEPVLFVAGGSGVTPVFGLIRNELLRKNSSRDMHMLYYARSDADFAFRSILERAAEFLPNFSVRFITGPFATNDVEKYVPDYADRMTYLCGPAGLMDAAEAHWHEAGLSDRLVTERFAPSASSSESAGVVPVHFRRSVQTVQHDAPTLLETAEQAGLRPASGCRMGICKTCVCTKVSGVTRDKLTGAVDAEPGSAIRICVSEPLGPVTLDL